MLSMKSVTFSRLKLINNRGLHRLLKINSELKRTSFFIKQDGFIKAINVRCIHCSSATNNFYKFIHKPRDAEKSKDSLSHSHVKQLLLNCKSVSEQQDAFYSYVNLSSEDVAARESARSEIEALLRPHFPLSSLRLIGSTVSGLGMKGCDMDVSFQTNDNGESQNCSLSNESVVLTKDIQEGKVPVSAFRSLNPKQKLHLLRKLLKDEGVVGTIIPGKHPILSFNYKGLGVDLAIGNISGLQGTNLMGLCVKLDPRVAPLFRFVSYWAKNHKLCGGAMKFKSYGLFLLVVYFLQTRQPPVLPTVEHMLKRTEFLKNLENWLYDVSKYVHQIEKSENVQTLEELLQEFFFFYAYFDFSYVICTFSGELVKSTDFALENPDFELNSISIQDPLNLSWNVTSGVNWKYCRHFSKEMLYACEQYQDSGCWHPRKDKEGGPWGVLSLLDSQPSFEAIRKKRVTLQIPITTQMQEADIEKRLISIFRHCLDFRCKFVDENELLRLNLNQSTTVESRSEENESYGTLLSRFLCTTSDTWFGRSNFEPQVGTTNLDSQIAATNLQSKVAATNGSNFETQIGATGNFESDDQTTKPSNLQSQVAAGSERNFKTQNITSNAKADVETTKLSNFDSQERSTNSSTNLELQLGSHHHILDAEREISKKLSSSRSANKKEEFTFMCECRFDGQCLNVIMDPVSSDIFITKLAIFLKDYIPKIINKVV